MRLAQVTVVVLAALSVLGCLSAPTTAPQPTVGKPVAVAVKPASEDAVLWEANIESLEAAFRQFAESPGTTPNPRFATLSESADAIRFAGVPSGWKVWREGADNVREIALDSSKILTYIGIASSSDKPFRAEREFQCQKGKGNTDFIETRCFRTRQGWVVVTLTAVAHKGTLGELLGHLRKHYGNYEGVCQEVQKYAMKS